MIAFSEHAVLRYDRRLPGHVPLEDRVRLGKVQHHPPGGLLMSDPADAYLVHDEAVFPLRWTGHHYVAVTCLRFRRISKIERRARRDAAREDWMEAA